MAGHTSEADKLIQAPADVCIRLCIFLEKKQYMSSKLYSSTYSPYKVLPHKTPPMAVPEYYVGPSTIISEDDPKL